MSRARRTTAQLAPNTRHQYARMIERAFSGDRLVANVAAWPESTKALLHAAIKHRFGDRAEELLAEVPLRWAPKRLVRIPPEGEMAAYEREAALLAPGKRALALLPLALGLRASEVLGLERKNVERAAQHGELIVLRKGGEEQALPASKARHLFEDLLSTPPFVQVRLTQGPLVRENDRRLRRWRLAGEILSAGQSITQYHALRNLIAAVGKKAGIVSLAPHRLRHAFATRMMRDGAPLSVIQWTLNHKSVRTTELYLHAGGADAEKYIRKL